MKHEAMDLATAVRILVWGEGRSQPPDRTALAQSRLFEALSPIVKQEYAKYRLGGRLDGEVETEFGTSEGDVLHDLFVDLVTRQSSPPGAPPQSNEAARAYLAATVRHRMTDLYRSMRGRRTTAFPVEALSSPKDGGDEEDNYVRVPIELIDDTDPLSRSIIDESVPGLPEMAVSESNWDEVLEGVIKCLMEDLSRVESKADDVQRKAVAGLREALPSAIRSAARECRTGGYVFVQRLLRLVGCRSKVTTMEKEVLNEAHARGLGRIEKGSEDFRRIRNNLDQQNRRTLEAVCVQLIREGVDEMTAHRYVKALSVSLGKSLHS